VFFFSSRRRHTRSKRDWSSDVCSSDLVARCGTDLRYQYRCRHFEPSLCRAQRRIPRTVFSAAYRRYFDHAIHDVCGRSVAAYPKAPSAVRSGRTILGTLGTRLVFAAIAINGTGALIGYAAGSGELLDNILGIPPTIGTLIFFALGTFIMYKGLEATGVAEAVITIAMAAIVAILVLWTFIGPGIEFGNLWILRPYF